jgi:hypothetical protein
MDVKVFITLVSRAVFGFRLQLSLSFFFVPVNAINLFLSESKKETFT